MKNFTNNFKQFTSRLSARWLIMALMLLVGTGSAWAVTTYTIYLKPNADWKKDGARFAVYLYGNGEKWLSMTSIDGTYYKVTTPDDKSYPYIIFCRMNGGNSTNNWSNKWNQTSGDNTVSTPTKSGQCYEITGWDNSGKWGSQYCETPSLNTVSKGTNDNNVKISGSQQGFTYTLYKDGTAVSNSDKTGDGNALEWTVTDAGTYTVKAKPTGSTCTETNMSDSYTYSPYTYPAVSTISATVDGDNLVCKGKITSMGSASKVVWAFTVLSTNAISKADSDWKYPNGENQITAANTSFTYNIPISSLSLTKGNTYHVRAMAVDLNNLGFSNNQYGNAVAGDAISFVYDPCIELPNDAYALSSISAEWTDRDITPTIRKKDEIYPTPTITYNGGSALPNKPGEYTIKATVSGDATYCNKEFDLGTFTITCPTVAAPIITTSATVCEGTQVNLSNYNGDNSNTVKWYSTSECTSVVTQPVTLTDNDTKYYAKAYDEASGCYSSEYSTLTFTVNPKPTITITGNTSAVLYEDVTLTATSTDGATIKWYEDEVEKGEGLTYVVTSETATSKAVTAKAFLNGCESTAASHTVNFSAEDCTQVPSNDIQITFVHPNDKGTKCQYWGLGTLTYKIGSTKYVHDFGNSTTAGTEGNLTIPDLTVDKITGVRLDAFYDYGQCTAYAAIIDLEKGYHYTLTLSDAQQTSQQAQKSVTLSKVSLTQDPEITAPAAKTISVSTTDGEGNIIFSGQVVKTGCANALTYGFAYSTDANADKNNWTKVECANTGNTAGTPYDGEKTGIEVDGTYYVCAYITNSAGTTYGAVTEITISTVKTPISEVAIKYSDIDGKDIPDPNPMCKGAIAYVKLSYKGSKYSNIKWLVEGVETNLVTDKGNGVWSYEIQGDGNLSVELKNDANTDPTWPYSNKLPFRIIPEPTAPYISINPASGVICQGSSATITVTNPTKDCAYKLVEEGSKAGFTPYESGDLTYKVSAVGKYYVVAQHNACTDNEYTSNQVAITKVISTDAKITIEPVSATTTPWEPVTITVKPDAGYIYELTYTDGNLAAVDGVRIKQNGDSYTYYIPRPWGTGDSDHVRTPINYGIKAQLKVDGEASECKLNDATATIQLKDEDNENCPK